MMNIRFIRLLFFLTIILFFSCEASDNIPKKKLSDSEKIANIKWNVKNVSKGIKLKTANINIFDSPQAIFMIEIDTAKANVNYFVGMPEMLATTSTQAALQNAIIAINGSYFNIEEGYSRHFVKINNQVIAQTEEKEFRTRATGIFTVTKNRIDISTWNKEKETGNAENAEYAVVSGPLVIDDDKNIDMWNNSFVHSRHPRSFAAFSNECLLLVAVDGRASERAAGMNLTELRIFARAIGCTDVINLDGGGSTTLYVKGEKGNGVVNVPSDGHERPVKSILYITPE